MTVTYPVLWAFTLLKTPIEEGKTLKSPLDQKRADYYLYTWQIREVQKLSRELHRPPSEIMRTLLTEALAKKTSTES